MVDDLTPDLHMKILHVQGGERSPLDVLLDGEEGQQGEPRIVPEHLENEVRVADLQEGTDVFLAGGQVAVQDAAVAGGFLRQQKRLGGDLLQVQILSAGEGVGGGGGEDDLLRLLQDLGQVVRRLLDAQRWSYSRLSRKYTMSRAFSFIISSRAWGESMVMLTLTWGKRR